MTHPAMQAAWLFVCLVQVADLRLSFRRADINPWLEWVMLGLTCYADFYAWQTSDWLLMAAAGTATVLTVMLLWRNRRKGRRRKLAKLAGDKSRAILRKMAEKMAEKMRQPLPEPA
jgi:hypothetical protein